MMNRLRGFTLIELLVVIAIIALLMAILMPALAKVRMQAKDVMGMKAASALANVASMYTNDYEGYFDTGGNRKTDKWANSWRKYYGDVDSLVCAKATKFWFENPRSESTMSSNQPDNNPATPYSAWGKYIDAVAAGEASPQEDLDWNETGLYGSFGSNSWIYNYTTKTEEASKFWRTINVEGADRIPLIADCQHIGGRPNVTDEFPEYNGDWDYAGRGGASTNAIKRFMMDRHQGGIHVVLFDLSVRKVGVKAVAWWLRWHRGYTGDEAFDKWVFDRNDKWPVWINPYRYEDY